MLGATLLGCLALVSGCGTALRTLLPVRAPVRSSPALLQSAATSVPAGMRVVTVSGWLRVPRARSLTRTLSSAAVIGEVTETITGMSAARTIRPGCPAPLNTYRVAFAPAPGARPVFVAVRRPLEGAERSR